MKGKILKNETREQKFDCAYRGSIVECSNNEYEIWLITEIEGHSP